jgi:hypothetical protein
MKYDRRERSRREAMSAVLLFHQHRVPVTCHLQITKVKKMSIVCSNQIEYKLDLHEYLRDVPVDVCRFTASNWDFDFVPCITLHASCVTALEVLVEKFHFQVFGFFTLILDFVGAMDFFAWPNRSRRSNGLMNRLGADAYYERKAQIKVRKWFAPEKSEWIS